SPRMAPSRAHANAVASPIPLEQPLIRTTLPASGRGSRLNTASKDSEVERRSVQALAATLSDSIDVLLEDNQPVRNPNTRFDGEGHADLKWCVINNLEIRGFVDIHADPMPHSVAKEVTEACLGNQRSRYSIDLRCPRPRPELLRSRTLRADNNIERR